VNFVFTGSSLRLLKRRKLRVRPLAAGVWRGDVGVKHLGSEQVTVRGMYAFFMQHKS